MEIEHSAIYLDVLFNSKISDPDFDDISTHEFEIIHAYKYEKIPDKVYLRIHDDPILEIILTREEIEKIVEALK